jgi:hypothetical protein
MRDYALRQELAGPSGPALNQANFRVAPGLAELAGKVRLFKVTLDSASTWYGGFVGYDADHDDEPAI